MPPLLLDLYTTTPTLSPTTRPGGYSDLRLPWDVPLLDIVMNNFLEELEGVELLVSAAGASRLRCCLLSHTTIRRKPIVSRLSCTPYRASWYREGYDHAY